MACCTGRCLLITLCTIQFIATVERQVFDFLGYMWAPIAANFLHIIIIIIGFFGALQYRPRIVIVYAFCTLLWLGWNIFVICIYLEVGILSRDSPILNIGTGHKSWWFDNGIGCKTNSSYKSGSDPTDTSRPNLSASDIEGCVLEYYYVEIIHAGIQCILAMMGFCIACYVIFIFTEEDDSFSDNRAQPVHDELEYIKMRYKSPARSSFRDNKMYATLTTQSTAYSTMSRGTDAPNYSDDSTERMHNSQDRLHPGSRRSRGDHRVPWSSAQAMPQTEIPATVTELPVDGQTHLPLQDDLGYLPPYQPGRDMQPDRGHPLPPYNPEDQTNYTYNLRGPTQGVTVI